MSRFITNCGDLAILALPSLSVFLYFVFARRIRLALAWALVVLACVSDIVSQTDHALFGIAITRVYLHSPSGHSLGLALASLLLERAVLHVDAETSIKHLPVWLGGSSGQCRLS